MLLALDVGNTEITAALFHGDDLQHRWRLTTHPNRTPDEWALALRGLLAAADRPASDIDAAVLGSVAPGSTSDVAAGVSLLTGVTCAVVDASSALPLQIDVEAPGAVGVDRLLNVIAARDRWGGEIVVVDLGTATTFDCVTGDGRFIGGVIMPGVRTAAEQLVRGTATLPSTSLTPPDRTIGRRTDESIRAGIMFGTADAVDGIVRRIKKEWPETATPRVIITGGVSALVAPLLTEPHELAPDLTLHGLRLAARHLGLRW